ncbi:MAG: DUF763 domain-containing protein [Thermoproteales archaeon]|nr:DUF763 domain-containing protein [Thermoproteales archaeon]
MRIAHLPLHGGKAPPWLVSRMIALAKPIVRLISEEYGTKVLLERLSDPFWFQALGCALGYDWHSSGVTTVLTAVLRQAINRQNLGIRVCGGKGKKSTGTPNEIEEKGDELGLPENLIRELKLASRLAAKVDNSAVQDGYILYHHAIFFDEKGNWVIIQQGMNPILKYARRYHWFSLPLSEFIKEPHKGIISERKERYVLNMVSRRSIDLQKTLRDISLENPIKVKREFNKALALIKMMREKSRPLTDYMKIESGESFHINPEKYFSYKELYMPRTIDWEKIKMIYEFKPKSFRELLLIKGLGARTLRALTLIAELIYGTPADWSDPVKYSFAFGGKDGVPFPVDKKSMDEAINFMANIVSALDIESKRKREILRRLGLKQRRELRW